VIKAEPIPEAAVPLAQFTAAEITQLKRISATVIFQLLAGAYHFVQFDERPGNEARREKVKQLHDEYGALLK